MSASDALRRVTQVTLLGKKYKIHRLSAMKIYAIIEEYHLDQLVKVIKRTAQTIDASKRIDFVREEMKKLPVGYALESAAKRILSTTKMSDNLATLLLHQAMDESYGLTIDDVSILFADADPTETQEAFSAVAGKEQRPTGDKSKPSRKRTAGRQK